MSHLPLTRASVEDAHALIQPHIHRTPVLTNTTLSSLASTPQTTDALKGTQWEGQQPANPKFKLFFKCENFQKIGAFKVRGAFHAVIRLIQERGIEEVRKSGVVTHSSGNHAQALALAAKSFQIPAHIVMPKISTPSKIAGTQAQGAIVHFSGSTAQEREAAVAEVIAQTGATLIPPYDHPNIILGQGTMALEIQKEVQELLQGNSELGVHGDVRGIDAVIAPCGGGGMLSGIAVALHDTGVKVFSAEPSFQGGDDARRGVEAGERITTVKTLTIADGLRTPLGEYTWKIISDKSYVKGLYAVTEQNIKDAMKLVLERMKCFVEPSAVVGLATILYNENFRKMVEQEAPEEGWNIGVVFSGGNTTIDAITKMFADVPEETKEREEGVLGSDGKRVAENVAG
ncbi:tryptophan synthase beta subunit-like PLP-dependent enzyme [Cucurbitaria berberidis CBS 394.84]|uniref:Tryptophan synthase beta subunit-like PLP-dependent enzyme n=1 Tax=Cucurbitaria berberidis CBS 394.84 TaxID=1168544 RepID=A0A9P4L6E6_9PLEO|nr:tryptophan synthase beta subunit-like PLP-dependent enzyme [Cucurbitaria berberidis CBS 394.84]KAF1842978.1 tryptophan synthase beta subunit-like PLP-dependent enzyme [Cucurbitaria berberidis CBS 394.84]